MSCVRQSSQNNKKLSMFLPVRTRTGSDKIPHRETVVEMTGLFNVADPDPNPDSILDPEPDFPS